MRGRQFFLKMQSITNIHADAEREREREREKEIERQRERGIVTV